MLANSRFLTGLRPVRNDKLYGVARQTEAVVGVVEVGRDAGAGGAAGDFDVVAPRSAAGGFALALLGPARIAAGRDGVVVGNVPVAAPFVNVVASVVETEGVGGVAGDGVGAGQPAGGVVRERLRRLVAPGKIVLLEIAASGALPFGFGGKTVGAAGLGGEPVAVTVGVEPGDAGDGLLGMIEILVVPEGRRVRGRGVHEERVFGVGDLSGGEEESVNPNAVDGAFAILTGSGAHEEPGCGDGDEHGLDGVAGLGVEV